MDLPYMQFFPADWLADCQILSLSARGAWQTIICRAWSEAHRGTVTLKPAAWARLFGCSVKEAERVIAEIEECGVADVARSEADIAVTSRRIARDWQSTVDAAGMRSASAANAARTRWGKRGACGSDATPDTRSQNRERERERGAIPATIEEAQTYAESVMIAPPIDPGFVEWWHDSREASGWVWQGTAIADWKANLRSAWKGSQHKAHEWRARHRGNVPPGPPAARKPNYETR